VLRIKNIGYHTILSFYIKRTSLTAIVTKAPAILGIKAESSNQCKDYFQESTKISFILAFFPPHRAKKALVFLPTPIL
jgi:hypothetical protein